MNISFNTNSLGGYKVRRQKFGLGSLTILFVIGAAFIGGGIVTTRVSKIDPEWKRVTGVINDYSSDRRGTDNTKTYWAIVDYEVDGESYQVRSSSGSSSIPNKGGPQEVAYNPDDPEDAKVVGGVGGVFGWIIVGLGVGLILSAPVLYMRSRNRSNTIGNLMQSGQKRQGVIVDVLSYGTNTSGVNETGVSNSYKVVVAATDSSGAVKNYTSDTLTGIGGLAMADFRNNPIPIDVYIDPANPHNYYVDVSDVPNLTPERIRGLIASAAQATQPQSVTNLRQLVVQQPAPPQTPTGQTQPSSSDFMNGQPQGIPTQQQQIDRNQNNP